MFLARADRALVAIANGPDTAIIVGPSSTIFLVRQNFCISVFTEMVVWTRCGIVVHAHSDR